MVQRTVTLTLPEAVYDQLRRRAQRSQRRVEDEAARAVTAAVAEEERLPADLEEAITALTSLDDAALLRISQSRPAVEDGILLEALADKRQREGLTEAEERLLAELIERHDRVMVMRAEAIGLLHARGHDVSDRVARA